MTRLLIAAFSLAPITGLLKSQFSEKALLTKLFLRHTEGVALAIWSPSAGHIPHNIHPIPINHAMKNL